MSWSALVLAGSRGPGCPVAALGGVSHKALLPIDGKPMIARVIEALAQVPRIDKVTVVIENPALLQEVAELGPHLENGYLQALAARPSPAQSTLAGVEALGTSGPVLMTTADNVLMTPEIVDYFLDHLTEGADVTAAIARTDMVMQAYPEARRTRLRFRDGGVGGCNLFAFQTAQAQGIIRFWRLVEENRKSPLTMLRQLGLVTALRYVTNTLTLPQALDILGKRTGTRLAVIDMPYAEAAIDVDKTEDFDLAEKILKSRRRA